MTYFYDAHTDTVRRFPYDKETGERWCKKEHKWVTECCARSACRWDEVVSEAQAMEITAQQ